MKSKLDVWKLDVYAWLRDVMQSVCIMEAARAAVMSAAFDYTILLFVYCSSKQLTNTSHCSTLLINNSSALALHFLALCKSNNGVHLVLQRKSRCHSSSISRDKAASPKYIIGNTLSKFESEKILRLLCSQAGSHFAGARYLGILIKVSSPLNDNTETSWHVPDALQVSRYE